MKRVLILGSAGMAGHVVKKYLETFECYQVFGLAKNKTEDDTIVCNVCDFSNFKLLLKEVKPDIVINCIGVLVRASQEEPESAILLNSYLPHFLKRLGSSFGFRLLHISTDCVFSGTKGSYQESDICDGLTFYAKSKALGEIIDDSNLTVRTSIIGPELKTNGTGLFHWFMNQEDTVYGYKNAYWSGVTTLTLADFLHFALQENITGLCQLSMPNKISKYDLLVLFKKIWNRSITIKPEEKYFCDKSMVSTRNDIRYLLPKNYETMLYQLKDWMCKHSDLYVY